MKNFYAFVAAVALGMLSSSAFTSANLPVVRDNQVKLHTIDGKINTNIDIKNKIKGTELKAQSRADVDLYDLSSISQNLYYDYFQNFPTQNSKFRNLQIGTEVEIVTNADGTYTIKNFMAIDGCNPVFTIDPVTGEGQMALGQKLLTNGGYQFLLATGDDQGYPVTEGNQPLSFFAIKNGLTETQSVAIMICDDLIGLAAYDKAGNFGGWGALTIYNLIVEPNATLKYSYDTEDNFGNPVHVDVNNRIYFEYREASSSQDMEYDELFLSNVMPWNYGNGITFQFIDSWIAAINQIAYPSEQISATEDTGDFFFCAWIINKNYYVLAEFNDDYTGITWPCEEPSLDMYPDCWSVLNEKWGFHDYTTASLIFDQDNEDGIIDMVNDEDVQPVYYNLQGMQLQHPAAGQITIVKRGNKVTKQIMK